MFPVTPSRRLAAKASLVAAPVIIAASTLTQPDFDASAAAQLAELADSALVRASAVLFLVSQLPFLVAILAIGMLLVPAAPRLSAWGTALGVLGCFGHTAFGGLTLTWLVMDGDTEHRDVHADLIDATMESPVMIFAGIGLVGTVLGLLLLSLCLFRSRTGPVWVGPALWAFLVVEFVGVNISSFASYLAVLLLGAAFVALAGEIRAGSASSIEASTPQHVQA